MFVKINYFLYILNFFVSGQLWDYSMLYNNNMNYGNLFGAYNPYTNLYGNYGMNSPFYDYKNMFNSWPFYQNGMYNDGMNSMYSNGMLNSMNTNGMNTNGMNTNSMNTNGINSLNNMFGATMMSPELVPNTRHVNFGSAGYRSSPLNKYQSLLKMKGTTTMNNDNCLLSMGCISNQWGQTKSKS